MKFSDYDLGAAMKSERIKAGRTTKEMASILSMSIIQYIDYEEGHRIPTWRSVQLFAQKLGIPVGTLFQSNTDVMTEMQDAAPTKLTPMEESLLTKFRYLTPVGKEEAIKRVAELTYVPLYSDPDYKKNGEMRIATVNVTETE